MTLPASGIYKITNLLNGKVYVGQSQNVFERKIQHFTALRNGNHENREMQKDWNKNNREKYWIDTLDTIARGYNVDWKPYKRKAKKSPQRKQKHYHKTR